MIKSVRALALSAALLLTGCATATGTDVDFPDPGSDAAQGWTQDRFDAWVKARAGAPKQVGEGEPVYWYSVGTLRAFPGGELLYRMEGYDIANAKRVSETKAEQYSRKIYIYRDAETNEVVREVGGQSVDPIAYPYQFITYELKEEDGEPYLETFVEQGEHPRVQKIGPGRDITVRQVGELNLYTAPLFLDFPIPGSDARYQTFENYDFVVPDEAEDGPAMITFMRYGPLPKFAQTDGITMGAMHLQTWRIEDYEDVPQSLRDYIEADAPLYTAPPADFNAIKLLQGGAK